MARFATLMLLAALLSMGIDSPHAAAQEKGDRPEALSLAERLPPKIHRIQKELPAWLQKTGNKEAAALMQKLGEQIEAKRFEEAEKTADSLLKMMGVSAPKAGPGGDKKSGNPPSVRWRCGVSWENRRKS